MYNTQLAEKKKADCGFIIVKIKENVSLSTNMLWGWENRQNESMLYTNSILLLYRRLETQQHMPI